MPAVPLCPGTGGRLGRGAGAIPLPVPERGAGSGFTAASRVGSVAVLKSLVERGTRRRGVGGWRKASAWLLEGEIYAVLNLCFGKALVVFPVPCPGLLTRPRRERRVQLSGWTPLGLSKERHSCYCK